MKVIAFSLWGHDPKYCVGAIKNTELALQWYPGWVCRFYCGSDTDKKTIDLLQTFDNTEIVHMKDAGNWEGMFWRFYAADSDAIMLSRDTDSRLSQRESVAVQEWLESDKDFHIMRDHPYHGTEILGGMWGARNGILKNITTTIEQYKKGNFWQVDQNFLREHIYPSVKDSAYVHDSFFNGEPNAVKFSTPRVDYEFIGEIFDANNQRHPDHFKVIQKYEQN